MTDHASAAQALGAGLTAVSIALVGVPHLALLWGFFGAAIILVLAPPEAPRRAILAVIAGGLAGAAGGSAAADWITGAPQVGGSVLVIASLVAGAGAKQLLTAAIGAAAGVLQRFKVKS